MYDVVSLFFVVLIINSYLVEYSLKGLELIALIMLTLCSFGGYNYDSQHTFANSLEET
jgi:hypothetical protein